MNSFHPGKEDEKNTKSWENPTLHDIMRKSYRVKYNIISMIGLNEKQDSLKAVGMGERTMKHIRHGKLLLILTAVFLSAGLFAAYAVQAASDLTLSVLASDNASLQYDVKGFEGNEEIYLFLPSGTSLSQVRIRYEGDLRSVTDATLDAGAGIISKNCTTDNDFTAWMGDGSVHTVTVLKSAAPSICITMTDPDPLKNTFEYLHADKDNIVLSTLQLYDEANAGNNLTNQSIELKGRGNSTWGLDKKPYQIKFGSKTPLLGLPTAKTWVLLANHGDASLLRTKAVLDLAASFGMPYTSESTYANLFINGEYLGNYQVTEKVQTGTNRVELTDPAGILVECDNLFYYEEDYYFRTVLSESKFTLKDSVSGNDSAAAQAAWTSIQGTINELEALLYAPDPDWTAISALLDVDSFVKYYFIQELAENYDSATTSMYLFQNGPSDKIHVGPAWDFDASVGNFTNPARGSNPTEDYVKNLEYQWHPAHYVTDWLPQLFRNEEFSARVHELYGSTLRDKMAAVPGNITAWGEVLNGNGSAEMNFARWDLLGGGEPVFSGAHLTASTYAGEVKQLKDWVTDRIAYLNGAYGTGQPVLRYSAYVEGQGWQPAVSTSTLAGTRDQSLRLQDLQIEVGNTATAGGIQVRPYVQALGWEDWKDGSAGVGSADWNLGLEAVQLKLTGDLARSYDLYYRTYNSTDGWMGWAKNGATAGTVGLERSMEAIEVNLVDKGTDVNTLADPSVVTTPAAIAKTDLAEGNYRIANVAGGLNLTVPDVDFSYNAGVVGLTAASGTNSVLAASKNADGSYGFRFLHSGKMLDYNRGEGRLVQWEAYDAETQHWYVFEDGSGNLYLRNKQTYEWVRFADLASGAAPVLEKTMDTDDHAVHFSFTVVGTLPAGPRVFEIPDGIYGIRSKKSGLVMDIYGGSTEEGADIIQWPSHGGVNQMWIFEKQSNGFYKITSVLNPAYSLDVYGGNTDLGNRVIQWGWHGGANQLWQLVANADGSYALISKLSELSGTGYFLDVFGGGTDPGVNVIQWTAHYGDNQKWLLERVGKYTVTYDSNGGSAVASASVQGGGLLSEPSDPTKSGVVFTGWYKDAALTVPWNFGKDRMPSGNLTLYAKWQKDYSGTYSIASKNSGLVMDVFGGSSTEGADVIQWPSHGGANQQWTLEHLGRGWYKISSVLNPSFVLDVYGGNSDLGNRVIQWSWHGGTNQQWSLIENGDGTVSLMSRLSRENGTGYLLDVYGGGLEPGVNVIQWTAHYGDNQRWFLNLVD